MTWLLIFWKRFQKHNINLAINTHFLSYNELQLISAKPVFLIVPSLSMSTNTRISDN